MHYANAYNSHTYLISCTKLVITHCTLSNILEYGRKDKKIIFYSYTVLLL